jgi:hypothetical protein
MGSLNTGNNERFIQDIEEACTQFPKFEAASRDDGVVFLRGELDIVDRDGKFWESYQIEIHPTDEYPSRFPLVYETSGKLPPIGDWHINEDTKTCCITVLPEEILICKGGITLSQFLRNNVTPYFFNQTFRRVEGYYCNGEYAHGIYGVFQYYDNILSSGNDLRKAIKLMIQIASGQRPGRTHNCLCGSKVKFRKCHREAFDKLEGIGKSNLLGHAYAFAKESGHIDLCRLIEKEY